MNQDTDFAALGVAAALLSLVGDLPQETDEEKRLKAVAADALEVFGLDREPSVSLGALIARDIRIAQANVAGVEWHVAVLTGDAARELDACGIVAIDRAYAEITKGRLQVDVSRSSGCPIALVAEGVPAVVLRALAKALRGEINAKTQT